MIALLASQSVGWIATLKLLSIPVVAALVGWGTNWVAIQLTFVPLEFVGLYKPWLGWQGIIPSKARKMAAIGVNATLAKLGSISEVFDQMEPDKITQQILTVVEPELDKLTDEVVRQAHPVLWESLPAALKQRIYTRVHEELPHPARVPAYLDNLCRLQLLRVDEALPEDNDLYELLERSDELQALQEQVAAEMKMKLKLERRRLKLTAFGTWFCKVCIR